MIWNYFPIRAITVGHGGGLAAPGFGDREMQIISDDQVRHRSETKGVVITRVQRIRSADGRTFEARYWSQFETGALHHVDSFEVVS